MRNSPLMRPGRAVITITRCDRYTDSNTEWVTKMTVLCSLRHSASRSLLRRKRVISSSAANGSSIRRISGSVTSARASETRIFMPPDNSRGKALANSASPTCASALPTRASASAAGALRKLQRQPNIVPHARPRHQRRLLEHKADGMPPIRLVAPMGDIHRARARRAEPRDQPQRGRLSAAGRPEQGDEFAARRHRDRAARAPSRRCHRPW